MNQTKAPKNWLKVETSLLLLLILALILTIAILLFVGWPGELPENFYKRLRIDKILELKNQIVRARMEAVTTIATVWGAIAIIFNVYHTAKRTEFLALNGSVESKNIEPPTEKASAQEQELKQARENGQLEEQEQITAHFLSAIEKLGSNDVPIRLGSIYVLERIANHSRTDYSAIVEVLTAFVRENAPFNPIVENEKIEDKELPPNFNTDLPKAEDEDIEPSQKLPVDIQAALTVLGRRAANIDAKNYRLDLSHTDMGGASLSSANLPGAFLNGVNLQRADLLQANLQGAFLCSANLQEAFLMGAKLQGTVFRGANLQGAFLVGADLLGADLTGANLKGAFLMGANLLGANLKGANLKGADLSEAEHLESGQIESAQVDSTTALPHNLEAPAEWTPTD